MCVCGGGGISTSQSVDKADLANKRGRDGGKKEAERFVLGAEGVRRRD